MEPSDQDDRLLAALRGEPVVGESPDEAAEVNAAARIGAAARRGRENVDVDPPTETTGASPLIAEAVRNTSTLSVADVVPLQPRRQVRSWLPSAAAAAIAIIAGTAFFLNNDSSKRVAVVELDALTEQGAATAELIDDGGRFELRIAVEGVASEGGYLELWLINEEITELLSLGPVEDSGTFILPRGLNPADFPVVDVSVESLDGDPTHSGRSVFRGQFSL